MESVCKLASEKLGIPKEQLENDILQLSNQLEHYRTELQDKPRTNHLNKKIAVNAVDILSG